MKQRLDNIISILDEKKAADIETITLDGKDYIADAVVVATSLNARHGESLLNDLKNELKPKGEQFNTVETSSEWIVADLGDIIVHIMTQEYRDKYTIEKFLEDLKAGKLQA